MPRKPKHIRSLSMSFKNALRSVVQPIEGTVAPSQKYHIVLTAEEQALVDAIDLTEFHSSHDERHRAYKNNLQPILDLLGLLSARKAVPKQRMAYWNDPQYNTGRGNKSHKGVFEKNGCLGQEIYTAPHFIPYLRYFLFGADLPDRVIADFERKVGNPHRVTSGDFVPIADYAAMLARNLPKDKPRDSPEEFFKLSLDMGLGLTVANTVVRIVKRKGKRS